MEREKIKRLAAVLGKNESRITSKDIEESEEAKDIVNIYEERLQELQLEKE